MRYAKLINNYPSYAPNPIKHNGLWYGNPPASLLLEQGYKPVQYTEPPAVESGYIAVPDWEETAEEIVQTWAVEPEPDEVDGERAMEILFEEGDGDG